jgi:hypothetical protein
MGGIFSFFQDKKDTRQVPTAVVRPLVHENGAHSAQEAAVDDRPPPPVEDHNPVTVGIMRL